MRSAVLAVLLLGAAGAVAVLRRRPEEPNFPPLVSLFDHQAGWTGEPDMTWSNQGTSLLVKPLP